VLAPKTVSFLLITHGLMLERIVPKGGHTLPDGRFVPEGTTVGMNPWVILEKRAWYASSVSPGF
jgi:Fe-S cluster assembly ATPase SufC